MIILNKWLSLERGSENEKESERKSKGGGEIDLLKILNQDLGLNRVPSVHA